MPSRRDILKCGLYGATGLFVAPGLVRDALAAPPYVPPSSPALARFVDQLPIPPTVRPDPVTGVVELTAAPVAHSFHQSWATPTTVWGYRHPSYAGYLGPTVEALRGNPVRLSLTNGLGAHPLAAAIDTAIHGTLASDADTPRLSLHLHGANTAAMHDGFPEDTFTPGNTRLYEYSNNQEAGIFWYHDHALGITRLNVVAGLAGFYLLRDAEDTGDAGNSIGLPSGIYEVPLVIQDRSFNADGSLFYPPAPWVPEFFGDVATVNGKAWPNLNVDRALYRFRILNGSNARFYRLKLSGKKMSIIQIGSDGGLFNAPVQLPELLLAPGERADVLIDFRAAAPGDLITLTNDAPVPYPNGKKRARAGGVPLPEIMQFTITANPPGSGAVSAVPMKLRGTDPLNPKPMISPLPSATAVTRTVTLNEIMGMNAPMVTLLDNVFWHEAMHPMMNLRIQVQRDTVEVWNIVNLTGDTHPIHLHLVQFQVLDRQNLNTTAYNSDYAVNTRQTMPMNGMPSMTVPAYPPLDPAGYVTGPLLPPEPNEVGWKDIVQCPPGMVTRIVVPFGARAAANLPFGESHAGMYVWHCHILDHEDNDMMLPFDVL